ncbi:acyl-CoA thioesterase [Paenarthrobacter sp. NPDC092416]|uniref:acyl-CoA thioesterase n=1 Tax=Paenarthrobacter sp. NPDC092416 TaxID=3364386 RepID=UPI0038186287
MVLNRQREVLLRFMAAPTDVATVGGKIHAGRILEWIDKAAYACAVTWTGSYCVTAYVGGASFQRPIETGDVVEVRAAVVYTGRTSLHVRASVRSGNPRGGHMSDVTECYIVFVSVTDGGKPQEVPPFVPSSLAELAEKEAAQERISPRAEIQRAMRAQAYTDAGTAPRTLLRFLAAPTDINWGGKTHGGTIMRWIDEAATLCATTWARKPGLAVYAGGINFHQAIQIGHVVEVEARIILTGTTSMHVAVHVRSGAPGAAMQPTLHCHTVVVAMDEHSRPTAVPSWAPSTEEDFRLAEHAAELNRLRRPVVGLEAYPS